VLAVGQLVWRLGGRSHRANNQCQWSDHWSHHFGGLIIGVTILVAISITGPPVLVASVAEPLIWWST